MKRQPKLTKKERKALQGPRPAAAGASHQHIHCIVCGVHLDPNEFSAGGTATMLRCQHGSTFPSCVGCAETGRGLLAEHDRTGQPVRTAAAWH